VTLEIAIVYGILLGAILLFVSERLRLDVVALLALLALSLTGILAPEEALAGFADPVVLIIAGLFVVGDGLLQTGVARAMGRIPARIAGESEVGLLVVIMILVALLSGFMSSTGTVAVMLPVVMGLAWARHISPSKLLIPLSVASLLGGMLTLIGTAPNIVVSNHLAAMGREPFGFFSFTPVGLVMVVVGIGFMALVGRRLLPDRPSPARPPPTDLPSVDELAGAYGLETTVFRVRIPEGSDLAGKTLEEADLPGGWGLNVVGVAEEEAPGRPGGRRKRPFLGEREAPQHPPQAGDRIGVGSVLLFQGSPDGLARLTGAGDATLLGEDPDALGGPETGIVEVLLTPRSRLLGKSLREFGFRDRYHLTVVGLKRLGELLSGDIRGVPLRFGDTLLVQGPWDDIRVLERESRHFVLALAPREMADALQPLHRAPVAVGIMVGMMLLMTLGIVPTVTAVLLAAVAMVLTGCVPAGDAYRSVNWESVVLIAGILPMATALEKTGGMDLLVTSLGFALSDAGPYLLLAALFVITSALSQVISNTATAVLIAPIAYQLALAAGVAPEPLMMTIAVAASTAFATPVASPVNTLVLGPGGYRFGDFFKVGVSIQGLILVATLLVVPLLFPF
jgi:di/tricarboxylate transporter